jgi:Fic family protein
MRSNLRIICGDYLENAENKGYNLRMYIYQDPHWPNFTWDANKVQQALLPVTFAEGRLLGKMENLGFHLQEQATLITLTNDVLKTSEIEGEMLKTDEVRSSIARHLGIDIGGLLPADRHVDGIVEMLLDATQHYDKPLTEERLCGWHEALFPRGMSGLMFVNNGILRTDQAGPMQVVSGHYGRERVHFEAPPASQLPVELHKFLEWFNQSQTHTNTLVKAAIAHLWFVTLHPFDDGNGRISRAIADMVLAQAEGQPRRFYSMSAQIRRDRKNYYLELEHAQKGTLDITPWIIWFLNTLSRAIMLSESHLEKILYKAKFWELHASKKLNERQIFMLNILFDGFKGKLSTSKWAKMMKCSQDTAARDIGDLMNQDILIKSAEGGRSTHYCLKDFPINSID